jgi:hypothetical protein
MFQYAFAKAYCLKNKKNIFLDISSFDGYFRKYELELLNIERSYASLKQVPFYERWKIKNKYLCIII